MKTILKYILVLFLALPSYIVKAQEEPKHDPGAVAKKLANPIASMISVPFQNNTDVGIGTNNGSRNTLNIQPVIPVKISSRINLINRIVLPVISQHDLHGEGTHENGLGDALLSAFFSPALSKNGWVWGVGPAILVPTATNDFLGAKRFAAGPTGIVLKQTKGWTIGVLTNQIWSTSGDEGDIEINQLFVQPFLTYNWKSGASVGMNSEIIQNWEGNNTTAFLNPIISGVTKLGGQIISVTVGPRIPLAAPEGNKSDFGVRAVFTLVFPK